MKESKESWKREFKPEGWRDKDGQRLGEAWIDRFC